jgi:hypothetical protein
MAGNLYLTVNSISGAGPDFKTVAAVQSSAGAGSAGEIVALNASGQIDATMLPDADVVTLTASEAISAGALINVWYTGSVTEVRNADNSSAAKRAHGWAPSSISMSSSGTVNIGNGQNSSVTGLTPGGDCWLGTVGAIVQTQPGAGTVLQKVGFAQTSTLAQIQLNPTVQQ